MVGDYWRALANEIKLKWSMRPRVRAFLHRGP